jgi:hypothetical protein
MRGELDAGSRKLKLMDFNVRSESVDVEQIMEQIRARIREKRGVDYTEQQLRELAAVKLEKFLDPRGVRSDLLQRFKERQPQYEKPLLPLYTFEDTTIYETHRGPLQWIRQLLNPILKLLFNPNPIIHALHAQVEINRLNLEREEAQEKRRLEMESLYYEIIHNLVFEMTRTGIEVKNLKMRVESLASRLEFNERRARALESVVVYKPAAEDRDEPTVREPVPTRSQPPSPPPSQPSWAQPSASQPSQPSPPQPLPGGAPAEGPGQRSRRRRRRRGRRGGAPASTTMGAPLDCRPDGLVEGERFETIEQAIAAEAHPSEPPAPSEPATTNEPPAPTEPPAASESRQSTSSGQGASTGLPDASPGSESGDASTLRQDQGRPEPSGGTTSAGSSGATSRDDDQQ